MRFHIQMSAMIIVLTMALSACVGISKQELNLLGSTVTPTKVDFVELNAYAGRAKAAYASETAIRSQYPATVRVSTPGKTDAQYFVERDDKAKAQYIAIRGTANKRNILEDAEIKVREDLAVNIPVHVGFDATARQLYQDMKPSLNPAYKTYITGHSLGGAIAALLAIYLVDGGYDVEKVITFGQPKFTTSEGVKRLGFLNVTRVVDENDIVPMLPPATLITRGHGAYEHAGPEIILLEGPHYVFLPVHDADRLSVGELWRSFNLADLSDHHMDHYIGRIASKASGAVEVSYNERENFINVKKKVASK